MRILGDPGAAEEVTIDVYHQVWRSAGSYDPKKGSPSAWLLTLARSRALDRLRSAAFRHRREKALAEGFDAAWDGPRPDVANIAEERRRNVLARQRCAATYEHTLELKIRLGNFLLAWATPEGDELLDVVVLELLPGGAKPS